MLRERAPAAHRHLGRAYALGTWAWRRLAAGRESPDDYRDEFWDFHESGDWTGFARLLLEIFRPRAVADVGCGDGKLLAAMAAIAPGLQMMGYDGSRTALARAVERGVPVEHIDLASLGRDGGAELGARLAACDLVACLETAEHLPPWCARPLVRVLARAPVVIFSAARPGQGGHLHLNERPLEFWRNRFEAERCQPHPSEGRLREALAALHLPSWYAANLQVFSRQ